MSKQKVKNFIDTQIENLEEFDYEIQIDENHVYAVFNIILGKKIDKEITFKILDEVLFIHSTTYGWKPVEKGIANKYFWIEILVN
ncbi:MAG: hypothetical protein KA070_00205 [Aliarcobacter sp.]|nr:hypothetical protein [Aliarcobacter sp.]